MSQPGKKRQIGRRRLADLKPHPKQRKFFADTPPAELQALADDIERNGLQSPIEITSDNVIICGHRRKAALLLLGREEAKVWVRTDLEGEGAVELRLIEDNVNRRQLSELEMVRCWLREVELLRDSCPRGTRQGGLNDLVAKQFGKSGRQMYRIKNVLKTPLPVQQAFEKKQINLEEATRVFEQSPEIQRKIADAITKGEKPKQVVARLAKARKYHQSNLIGKKIGRFLRDAVKTKEFLKDVAGAEIARKLNPKAQADIRIIRTFLKTLLDACPKE